MGVGARSAWSEKERVETAEKRGAAGRMAAARRGRARDEERRAAMMRVSGDVVDGKREGGMRDEIKGKRWFSGI